MSTDKRKKGSHIITSKGAGKVQALSASVAKMQKAGCKFIVIDSKEFEKEAKSLLV